jgi:hypothetical protein
MGKINSMAQKQTFYSKQLTEFREAQDKMSTLISKEIENMIEEHEALDERSMSHLAEFKSVEIYQRNQMDKFVKHISTEYVDFFKNRKRIKIEMH